MIGRDFALSFWLASHSIERRERIFTLKSTGNISLDKIITQIQIPIHKPELEFDHQSKSCIGPAAMQIYGFDYITFPFQQEP